MREIKFRAWDDTLCRMHNPMTLEEIAKGTFSNCNWYQLELMQFTGLHDKSGKEIYEGDIVKDPDGNVFEVIWNKGAASYLLVQRYVDMFEVIGNVHDNPDYWRNQNE